MWDLLERRETAEEKEKIQREKSESGETEKEREWTKEREEKEKRREEEWEKKCERESKFISTISKCFQANMYLHKGRYVNTQNSIISPSKRSKVF